MPIDHILSLLIAERDRLNVAINALTGGAGVKRRGRPPKNPTGVATVTNSAAPSVKRSGRKFSAAQRKQQAERMRAYWAKRKKGAGKKS